MSLMIYKHLGNTYESHITFTLFQRVCSIYGSSSYGYPSAIQAGSYHLETVMDSHSAVIVCSSARMHSSSFLQCHIREATPAITMHLLSTTTNDTHMTQRAGPNKLKRHNSIHLDRGKGRTKTCTYATIYAFHFQRRNSSKVNDKQCLHAPSMPSSYGIFYCCHIASINPAHRPHP